MTLEAERRLWVALAARALQQAGERELAARLFESVASYKQARAMLASMGQWARLADCCAAAAAQLRAAGREAQAVPWLAEEARCHRLLVGWAMWGWRFIWVQCAVCDGHMCVLGVSTAAEDCMRRGAPG